MKVTGRQNFQGLREIIGAGRRRVLKGTGLVAGWEKMGLTGGFWEPKDVLEGKERERSKFTKGVEDGLGSNGVNGESLRVSHGDKRHFRAP